MMRLFISYTTRDGYLSRARLADVGEVIKRHGRTFIDALHNDSDKKQSRVEFEMAIAQVVVFLKTPASENSPWVQKEQQLAAYLQKIRIEIFLGQEASWSENLKMIDTTLEKELATTNLSNFLPVH